MSALQAIARPQLGRDSGLQLLVIEDSSSDSELVRALLEDELPQSQVDVARDLKEALRMLDAKPYDAALADLSLPDADGLAVVRAVRSAHPLTALLVLTGRADGELELWALAEGAQDYLVKGRQDGPRLVSALLHALQRHSAEIESDRYLQLARGLLDALESPTCAVNGDSVIVALNESWSQFMTANEGVPTTCGEGTNYLAACQQVAKTSPEFADAEAVATGLRDVLARRLTRFQHEYPCHSPSEQRWFSVRITPAEIAGTHGAVINHVDVSAMHRVQTELSHQTMHDDLTGLPNRLLLNDRLDQALKDADRRHSRVGVVFLDLDHFKRVNDSLGHTSGDDLIVQVTERLRKQIRSADTLCRYSGDEFVIVWRDLSTSAETDLLSQRLTEAFTEPFALGHVPVSVTASIGIAVGQHPQSSAGLLQAADMAMYEAKRLGRNCVYLFSEALRRRRQRRIITEGELRDALRRGELRMHYQPIIDLDSGLPVAVEALVRWQHPKRGLLPASEFIPDAESSGLVVPLDRWTLEQACHDAAGFTGLAAGLPVAINVSGLQLVQPDVAQHMSDVLERSGVDPHRVMLEIDESALMENEERAAIALRRLSHLGVRIAIDNFGTGLSSLRYLPRYPIDIVKLDRAVVKGLGTNHDDEAVSRSVISLTHTMQAVSVAAGVETQQQYATLRAMGCQQAQGFHWSAAVPLADLSAALLAGLGVPTPVSSHEAVPNAAGGEWTAAQVAENTSD